MNHECRILLLSAKLGAGHVRAAEAVEHALRSMSGVAVCHREALSHMPCAFRLLFAGTYAMMLRRAPYLYRALYQFTERRTPQARVIRWAAALVRLCAASLREENHSFAPHCVVCTHSLPATRSAAS